MNLSFRCCGPKLSICGIILSVWGIIQLVVMAFALSGRNLAFVEDLNINETGIESPDDLQRAIEQASAESAHNCWVAVGLYTATLIISIHQFWLNNRGVTARYHRQL